MANRFHLEILQEGVEEWNLWRRANPDTTPDLYTAVLTEAVLEDANLSGANLIGADLILAKLSRADLSGANLSRADLTAAELILANLSGANLSRADLSRTRLGDAELTRANLAGARLTGARLYEPDYPDHVGHLRGADLTGADLTGADLKWADLVGANLTRAKLTQARLLGADLTGAHLVETEVEDAELSGAKVYGIAAWNLKGTPKGQIDLLITPDGEPAVTIDDLKVAQFIHLLLSNPNIRDVIKTITSKVVLILGRFTPERKAVLDALRDNLRSRNLTPVLFDFEVPAERDITETVTLLARMARFIVADLTDPASIPMELQAIAPHVAVPIRTIVHEDQAPFSMFGTLEKYHWVLPPYRYGSLDDLLANVDAQVVEPAEAKRQALSPDRIGR